MTKEVYEQVITVPGTTFPGTILRFVLALRLMDVMQQRIGFFTCNYLDFLASSHKEKEMFMV